MSLYADYIRELTQDHIIETENGFATYRFSDEKTVYILDIYIVPEARKTHAATDIADQIVKIARERGCTKVLGSVIPSNKGSNTSVKVLMAYGMTLDSSADNFILFKKDI